MRRRSILASISLTLAGLAGSPASLGQPLLDEVPQQAMAYVGWAGTEQTRLAYADSTLQQLVALVKPEQITAAWRSALPMIRHHLDEPTFNEVYRHFTGLLQASARGQMAIYLTAGPADAMGRPTPPGLGMLWRPADADDRQALLAALKYFADQARGAPFAVELSLDGPSVQLLINRPGTVAAAPTAGALNERVDLAASSRFQDAWTRLNADGPIVGYVDLPRISAYATEWAVATQRSPRDVETLLKVLEALNLKGLGPIAFSSGFDGQRWRSDYFLAAPAPRTGLAALLEAPAISEQDLALPPANADWVGLLSFDFGQVVDLTRATLAAADPAAADQFEQALAQASTAIGIDVETRLLRGLGTSWVVFNDPALAGDSAAGLVLMNPLQDPEGVGQGLRAVQALGNLALFQALNDQPFKLQIHTQAVEGLDIHSLMLPLIAPSWAILDGKLIVGLYPQTLVAAKDRFEQTRSLRNNPAFEELVQSVGTRRLTGLSWVNLPETAEQSYGSLLASEHLITGIAAMATGQPMPQVLPPLARLQPLLEPCQSLGWLDEHGWHAQSHSPFPGASILGPQAVGGAALGNPLMSWIPALLIGR